MLAILNCLTEHRTERTQQGAGSAMKAVGVTGPDFMPRLFDIGEPIAAPDGVVVDVTATPATTSTAPQSAGVTSV